MDNTSRKGTKCKKSLRYQRSYHNPSFEEGQTAQWQKQKGQTR